MSRPQRILIVDDHPINIQFLGAVLRRQGYQVESAGGGLEALAAVRAAPPDLIISDIHMPSMNGFEFLRQLKTQNEVLQENSRLREEVENIARR